MSTTQAVPEAFEAMGKPVPEDRRDAAYSWLRSIGIGREEAWQTVQQASTALERDHPHEVFKIAMQFIDLTGAYRLMALLLTSPAKAEPIV
jgi:hypothetical protein